MFNSRLMNSELNSQLMNSELNSQLMNSELNSQQTELISISDLKNILSNKYLYNEIKFS